MASARVFSLVFIYAGSMEIYLLWRNKEHRIDVSSLELVDVLHGLVSHDCPDVLSIMCLIFGCGRTCVFCMSFHAAMDAAMSMIAVANSRSLIDILGCFLNSVVSFCIACGQGM